MRAARSTCSSSRRPRRPSAAEGSGARLDLPQLEHSIQRRALLYDKSGEEHYNLISALHKSMRNSDPDAAVYWVARMLEAGEDPLYIARRLIRFASEDIGNADPQALTVAVAAKDAAHFIGMPEGNTALAQAAIYLATAPKSNAVYTAYGAAAADAHTQAADPVPLHLRNAPTKLMKELDVRQGLPVRARRAGRDCRHDVPAASRSRTGSTTSRPIAGSRRRSRRRLEEWKRRKSERRQDLKRSTPNADSRVAIGSWQSGSWELLSPRRPCRSEPGHLAEHLRPHRQDEREAVVALHPADRNPHQVALLVQHAAARHARMAVGQARDQAVRRSAARRSRC